MMHTLFVVGDIIMMIIVGHIATMTFIFHNSVMSFVILHMMQHAHIDNG